MSGTTDPGKAREDAGVAEERVCGTCRFFHPVATAKQGACMLNPPVVHIMVIPESALNPASLKQVPANTRPTVDPKDTCSHHKFADELTDAEMVAEELSNIAKWLREGITGGKK